MGIIKNSEHADSIEQALYYLEKGQPIILPTETVYGLAADATRREAIAAIYAIKNRPNFNPLIAHMADQAMVEEYCHIDALSRRLMAAFWPGPLTFILPLKEKSAIHSLACAGLPSLAVRIPRGIFRDIVHAFKRPLVAPSANISGRLSPTNAQAAHSDLGEKVPFILDDGACSIGVESTIIKVTQEACHILRPGGVSREALLPYLDRPLRHLAHDHAIEAPGMLASHYAPKALIRLSALEVYEGEALLLFGQQYSKNMEHAPISLNLSPKGDLQEAAMHLFDYLKKLDQKNIHTIAVQPIPREGLGEAIYDRLQRAAQPRMQDEG